MGTRKKGEHVGHWIPVIEDYLRTAPDADYIRLASSYLEGGSHALWTNVHKAYKRENGGAEPPNPHQFFRQTLEANYGLQDLDQKYWDTWNSLRMGPSQSVTEYNVDFQQALTDLAGHVINEQVKIENYRAGLQHDLRQLCRASPTGARWARLQDLMQYATLQWPVVQERIAKSCYDSSMTDLGQSHRQSHQRLLYYNCRILSRSDQGRREEKGFRQCRSQGLRSLQQAQVRGEC
jgi:hypothetical protein